MQAVMEMRANERVYKWFGPVLMDDGETHLIDSDGIDVYYAETDTLAAEVGFNFIAIVDDGFEDRITQYMAGCITAEDLAHEAMQFLIERDAVFMRRKEVMQLDPILSDALDSLEKVEPELGRRLRKHQDALDAGTITLREWSTRTVADLLEHVPKDWLMDVVQFRVLQDHIKEIEGGDDDSQQGT